jgi:hypothetical protein
LSALSGAILEIACNEFFDNYDIEPAPIEASVLLVNADLAEPMFSAERAAGFVERKNAR